MRISPDIFFLWGTMHVIIHSIIPRLSLVSMFLAMLSLHPQNENVLALVIIMQQVVHPACQDVIFVMILFHKILYHTTSAESIWNINSNTGFLLVHSAYV